MSDPSHAKTLKNASRRVSQTTLRQSFTLHCLPSILNPDVYKKLRIAMASIKENVNVLFAPSKSSGLPPEIMGELESILRTYSISPQEIFYKWESYSLRMGSEDTKLDLDTVRMFKEDMRDNLGTESRTRHQGRGSERKSVIGATPRSAVNGSDVFGMLDELTPNALPRARVAVNGSNSKRKADFESPAPRKVSKPDINGNKTPRNLASGAVALLQTVPFSGRQNAGQTLETLNGHLPLADTPLAPFAAPRIKAVANTDIKKFNYKPMAMRLSESSEILDDRIDDFLPLIQKKHNLDDTAFGNAAIQSTNEIVAVGRISSDSSEGKFNSASIVLETSRRTGAGLRVPLKLGSLSSYQFFPGQIVALRGTNASGEYFTVSEILPPPLLPVPVSTPSTLDTIAERLAISEESTSTQTLNVLLGSGPYTADDNLEFEPLQALCSKASDQMVDAMILTGPFLDIEHPLLASGDFDMPVLAENDFDATMSTLFRLWILVPLQRLCSAVPNITIILVPSVRDAVSKHVSWPQEQISRVGLSLPKQIKMLPNPCMISLNEVVFGISSQDILYELSREQISHGGADHDLMSRLPRYLIEQRHFFPLFPSVDRELLPKTSSGAKATGACLDVGYLKLGEWLNVRPDVLIVPSMLTPSIKVVESVMCINPGPLSKRKAPGTCAQMSIQPRILKEEERVEKSVAHKLFERARVDVVRI